MTQPLSLSICATQKCRFEGLQSIPITSSKSDQIFQMVSRKESTPWTKRSVALEKNWTERGIKVYICSKHDENDVYIENNTIYEI